MLPLVVGSLLAVVVVAYVLYPLLFGGAATSVRRPLGPPVVAPPADEDAIVALREIEFDRATGKLSDAEQRMFPTAGPPPAAQSACASFRSWVLSFL